MPKLEEHLQNIEPGLKEIILEIAESAKIIRTGFHKYRGEAGTENIYGEEQEEMDTFTDRVLTESFRNIESVATISSEEHGEVEKVRESGRYSVTMDPLDGSSLLDVNLAVGTIIGIHDAKDPYGKGRNLAAAVYVLYGPQTILIYTVGKGVHSFVLDKTDDFELWEENIRIPEGKIYSPGGIKEKWVPIHQKYIQKLENEGFKLRYSGCFVADVHSVLKKGGVFTYPALKDKPQGKLRMLFEAVPMGFIVENAGGRVSDGKEDILEKTPKSLDARTPVYIGSAKEIEMIEKMNKSP